MKKLILLYLLTYSLFGSVNQIQNDFTPTEKEYISTQTVTLGMIKDYYPFSFEGDESNTGFSHDYINLIREKSGLKIEIEMDNWSNSLKKFKNKQLDMIDTISFKTSRASYTNFTESYFEIPNVIFARKNEFKKFTGFESLRGKDVGITEDIYYYEEIKDLGFNLVEFKDSRDKMKALAYGKIDAVFNNLISGQKYIKQGGYSNIKILEELDSKIVKKEDLRIGIKKEDQVLFSIIHKSMAMITREEQEELNNKWFAAKIQLKDPQSLLHLTSEEKLYLQKKKQITMCIDPDWLPFEKFDENGNHIGMTAEYYDIFRAKLNTDIKLIQTKTWMETIQNVQSRKCDILSLAMETPNRKEYLNFTSPYLKIPIVIATKVDVPFINHIDDIKKQKVGITKGYAFVEILREKYPNLNIVEVKNIEEGLILVNKGELFGFIGTLASISHQFQTGLRGELKISGKLGENWELGIGVRKDDKILFNILEQVVQSIDSQKQQQILNNWISIKYEEQVNYVLLWQILIVVSLLLSFLIYRHYSLQRINTMLQKAVEDKTKDLKKLNDTLELKVQEELEKNNEIHQKLFKSEKMAAMGEMIGNIAHQWRQPLSAISTASTGIIMEKEYGVFDESKLIETCTIINNNAQYLSKTIDDFKNFIEGERTKSIFNLSENVDSFLNLVESSIKNHEICIIQDIPKDIIIDGYANELTQCFINIFNNAKDALTENIKSLNTRYLFITAKVEKDKVVIKFKDNAQGIPDDLLRKIFEPYFTTKHKSLGTGLGLHMTYNLIVDGMGGNIEASNVHFECEEEKHTGAEFIISLPIN